MKRLEKAGFFALTVLLSLAVACGGSSSSSSGTSTDGGNGDETSKVVDISVEYQAVRGVAGKQIAIRGVAGRQVTFTVKPQNTEVGWPSVTATNSYTRIGNQVTWTLPNAEGTYEFVVTAASDTANPKKTAKVTVAVWKDEVVDISTSTDEPDARDTFVEAANAGKVAGCYEDAGGKVHSFVKDKDDAGFTPITDDAAVEVWASAINNTGTVAGTYADEDGNLRGFTYDSTNGFTSILPGDLGATNDVRVLDIDKNGKVAGFYWDEAKNQYRGFTRTSAGDYEPLDYQAGNQKAANTYVFGLNDGGTMVGYFEDAGGAWHGFVKDSSGYREVVPSGAAVETEFLGVNNSGAMVGIYWDADGWEHSFVLAADGKLEEVAYPGASGTWVTNIDDEGRTTGYYWDAAQQRYFGFVW